MGWRTRLVVCLALCGAGSMLGGARAETVAEGYDALGRIVGNTIRIKTGTAQGNVMYVGKDGTLIGLVGERRESGKWSFTDGKLCFVKGTGGRNECGVMRISGSSGTFTIDGREVAFTIEPGNKVELSAAAGTATPGLGGAKALVGHTLEGDVPDHGLTTVFVQKDGVVLIQQGARKLKGTWSLDGDTMCFDIQGKKDCFTAVVKGDRAKLTNTDKVRPDLDFALLDGNARNL